MKNSIKTMVVMTNMILMSACGNTINQSTNVTNSITLKDKNGTTLGYVTSVGQDTANIYSSELGQYVFLEMNTGAYTTIPLYYSGANCTGNVASSYYGMVGKSVVYGNSKYFVTTTLAATFAYQSTWIATQGCTNIATTAKNVANVTLITQPKDFTTVAPLTLNFQ